MRKPIGKYRQLSRMKMAKAAEEEKMAAKAAS